MEFFYVKQAGTVGGGSSSKWFVFRRDQYSPVSPPKESREEAQRLADQLNEQWKGRVTEESRPSRESREARNPSAVSPGTRAVVESLLSPLDPKDAFLRQWGKPYLREATGTVAVREADPRKGAATSAIVAQGTDGKWRLRYNEDGKPHSVELRATEAGAAKYEASNLLPNVTVTIVRQSDIPS